MDYTPSMDTPLHFTEAPLDREQGKTVTDKISDTIEPNELQDAQLPGIHAVTQPTRRSTMPAAHPGETATPSLGNGPWPRPTTHKTHQRYYAKRVQRYNYTPWPPTTHPHGHWTLVVGANKNITTWK